MTNEQVLSFKEVYDATYSLLIKIAFHITGDMEASEDLCQEAYLKYYTRKEPLPTVDQAKYWLIRVVKNLCYNYSKRKGREIRAYDKFGKEAKTFTEPSDISFLKAETGRLVQEALDKLPFSLRIVLILREYGGLNYKEIGSILKITEGNVKVRVFRARERLSELLKEDEIHVS